MSAGRFTKTRYEANNDTIYAIRVQPETLELTLGGQPNSPPAGAVDGEGQARVRGSRRRFGITGRRATLEWIGAAPTGYDSRQQFQVPILTQDLYDSLSVNATEGTYLGAAVRVVGLIPEQIR